MSKNKATPAQKTSPASNGPMEVADLDFYSLLRRQGDQGQLYFNQRRAVIFDVEALGVLRKQLIETLGPKLAMGVLVRFGYSHGYNDAQMLKEQFDWASEAEWLAAGPALHTLEGLVQVEPTLMEFDRETDHFHVQGIWRNSYEAEEHLNQHGPAEAPVCWMLTGYASGYASAFWGRQVLAIETACVGQGDDYCQFEIKPVAAWGPEAKPYLSALEQVDVAAKLEDIRRLQREKNRLAALNELGMAMGLASTMTELFGVIAERLSQLINGDQFSLALLNEEEWLEIFVLDKTVTASDPTALLPLDDSTAMGRSILNHKTVTILDTRVETGYRDRWLAQNDLRSSVVVPLVASGRVMGAFEVASQAPHTYSADHEALLSQLASLLATSLENRRLLEQTQQRAAQLEETTTFLNSVVENIPTMVFVKEADELRFIRFNKAGEELIGLDREEMMGKNDYDFFPEDEADFFVAKDREVLNEGELVEIPEEPIQTVHQGIRYLHTRKVPILGPEGKPRYLLGISEDITERKEAEEALAKRATALETVAEVGVAVSTTLEPEELLQTVADLTKERFELYHAHIYLLNDAGNSLELAAGAGEVGRKMVTEGWRIPLNRTQSLVARAARTRRGVIVNDVQEENAFFQNPLLPDTRSELAVPIIAGQTVMGVLDVQSDQVGHFTQQDLNIQTILASQVAHTLRNARLFENVFQAQGDAERRLQETELLQELSRALTGALQVEDVIDAFLDACTKMLDFDFAIFSLVDEETERVKAIAGRNVTDDHIQRANHPLDSDDIMADIIRTGQTEVITGWDERFDSENFEAEDMASWGMRVFTPIVLRDENIGLIEVGFNENIDVSIQDSHIRLLRSLIDQTALALESAQRYELSQKTAQRLSMLNEMAADLNQANSITDVFKITATKTKQILEGDRISATLLDHERKVLKLMALDGEQGAIPLGAELPLENTAIGQAVQEKRLIITPNTEKSDQLDNKQLSQQGLRSTMVGPLMAGGKTIGTLNLASTRANAYGPSDESLMRQITTIIASVIESRRLFDQTQATLDQTERLYVASQAITLATNRAEIIEALITHIDHTGLDRIVATLLQPGAKETQVKVEAVWDRNDQADRFEGNRFTSAQMPIIEQMGPEDSLLIDNVETTSQLDETSRAAFNHLGVKSAAILPLSTGQRLFGWLLLETTANFRTFEPEEIRPYNALTGQAAVALESQRLLQETQQKARREQMLREVTSRIRGSVDVDSVMRTAVQEVGRALGRSTFVHLSPDNKPAAAKADEEEA